MTLGDVASLIAAIAFVLLVGLLAVPLVKLGRVFDQAGDSLKELTDHSVPILDEAASTVVETNTQLAKVDAITTSAAQVAENVSALSGLYSSVLGSPLIKVASFAYGVQHATARAFARFTGKAPDDASASDAPGPALREPTTRRPGAASAGRGPAGAGPATPAGGPPTPGATS